MRTSFPRLARPRLGAALAAAAAAAVTLIIALGAAAGSRAAAPSVSVFPIPGDRVATRNAQITIRGLPTSQFGSITATGSKSGVHTGVVKSDSDGQGGSFLPAKPFTAGETVTVKTALNVIGGRDGSWSFTVETPAHPAPPKPLKLGTRTKGDLWTFKTRPDLQPAAATVVKQPTKATSPGDLFVAPQAGPKQAGVELLGPYAGLIYFKPIPHGDTATDFRVQSYDGHQDLTWWQGIVSAAGVGYGEDEIYDSSYRPVATVKAGNGLRSDLHEFQLTPQGTALVTAYQPVLWDASKIKHGSTHEIVLDAIVQEIDIKTGLVLFQWDSLDHVSLGDSYAAIARHPGVAWDYFHVNSIQKQPDGNLLVSARNTSAVYDIDGRSGRVLWTLSGKRSSFKMGKDTRFYFQHNARFQRDGSLTLFDDAGAPFREPQSRGLTLRLDTTHKTATLAGADTHKPALRAAAEGNLNRLPNGDDLVGWGQANNFTEFDTKGNEVFDAKFVGGNSSYRAYRSQWTGLPVTKPAIAAHLYHGHTSVSASWNGTTTTSKWRILGGASPKKLRTVATDRKTAFETTMRLPRREGYVQVQALDARGAVLATSNAIKGS
jgi:hypothetical protein